MLYCLSAPTVLPDPGDRLGRSLLATHAFHSTHITTPRCRTAFLSHFRECEMMLQDIRRHRAASAHPMSRANASRPLSEFYVQPCQMAATSRQATCWRPHLCCPHLCWPADRAGALDAHSSVRQTLTPSSSRSHTFRPPHCPCVVAARVRVRVRPCSPSSSLGSVQVRYLLGRQLDVIQ